MHTFVICLSAVNTIAAQPYTHGVTMFLPLVSLICIAIDNYRLSPSCVYRVLMTWNAYATASVRCSHS